MTVCSESVPRGYPHPPSGRGEAFSLLEVILALAILAGAVAVLSEVSGIGMRHARIARELTHAQLLCESKLEEITAGLEPLEAQKDVPLGTVSDPSEPDWLYSIEVNSTANDGLVEVRVTVRKDEPAAKRPVEFSLVCWMLDPDAASDGTGGEATSGDSSGDDAS